MASEKLLQEEGYGNEMEQIRESIGRISSLLKARKVARKWRQKSRKGRTGDEEEQQECREFGPTWREKLGSVLESTPVHILIVGLLLLDLLATAIDLLLTIHNTSADLRECSQAVSACRCDSSGFSTPRKSWEFLHWISVAILCILLLNVLALMIAFGVGFFKHAGYILDLFVVTSAFVLEVFFEADTAGLLIILNLWRIVRVAHGIFEVTDEAWENEIEDMKERLEHAEENYKRECSLKDERILQLESRLNVVNGHN